MATRLPIPNELESVRKKLLSLLSDLEPAGDPRSDAESRALFLSSRTDGGRALPEYYLVYFLLVDFLGYENLGQWEKVAWVIPVRYRGRLYSIEHRKFGVGVFAPNYDPQATMTGTPSAQNESDATAIAEAVTKAVVVAKPYFAWRAELAVSTSGLNVVNEGENLFKRYLFFRDKFDSLNEEIIRRKDAREVMTESHRASLGDVPDSMLGTWLRQGIEELDSWAEAKWYAQAAIDAFFSWTEHVFIHVAILQGHLRSGHEVAALAGADWKAKFKAALDLAHSDTKGHYDKLLELRAQIRNFMAHGAFGKNGQAFEFHSGAGAVPVLLTQSRSHRFAFTGKPPFDEAAAMVDLDKFVEHLWSGSRAPAKLHVFSGLPAILTYVVDGTYQRAMRSDHEMGEFVEHLARRMDNAANMDW